ncbi:MAG TPA: hypothetical protein VHJ39_07135 [Solirubrobacteraceae bacterium]|nr:hypothetical protein [Solirubrobacteraceae bacterium]
MAFAAHAEVQAGMVVGVADRPEPGSAGDDCAGADGYLRHRHVRHAPIAAAHRHEVTTRANTTGDNHPAAARGAHALARRGLEVDAPVLAGPEWVGGDVEAGSDVAADGVGEDEG